MNRVSPLSADTKWYGRGVVSKGVHAQSTMPTAARQRPLQLRQMLLGQHLQEVTWPGARICVVHCLSLSSDREAVCLPVAKTSSEAVLC